MNNIKPFLNVSVNEKMFFGCIPHEEAANICLENATSILQNEVISFFMCLVAFKIAYLLWIHLTNDRKYLMYAMIFEIIAIGLFILFR